MYDELFDKIADKDRDEMKADQERCTEQEDKIQDFLTILEKRYYELEAEEADIGGAPVSAPDKSMADLEQVMEEQLEDSRRREEEEKRTRKEKERITREITEAKLHIELEDSKVGAELISCLATKIPRGTWKSVEEKIDKLNNPDLTARNKEAGINSNNILGWSNTKLAANQATNLTQEVNDKFRSENME